MTAKALTAFYDENEVAADDKIGGRKVEVKGVVQSIDKDFNDVSNRFESPRV
ncbi:OB-fold putative lipoprotein (plasmid) [Enterobacter hormaechei subsp. xiangfangensis]|nr:OB-fold putative lipoprotein [Enterobacter hormaechei subsp. xiangfangensis]